MNKETKLTKIAFDVLTFTYFKYIQQWKNFKNGYVKVFFLSLMLSFEWKQIVGPMFYTVIR